MTPADQAGRRAAGQPARATTKTRWPAIQRGRPTAVASTGPTRSAALLGAHPQRGGDGVAADDQAGQHAHGGQQHVGDRAGAADLRHHLFQLRVAGQQVAAGRGDRAGDGAERDHARPASRSANRAAAGRPAPPGCAAAGWSAGPEPGREHAPGPGRGGRAANRRPPGAATVGEQEQAEDRDSCCRRTAWTWLAQPCGLSQVSQLSDGLDVADRPAARSVAASTAQAMPMRGARALGELGGDRGDPGEDQPAAGHRARRRRSSRPRPGRCRCRPRRSARRWPGWPRSATVTAAASGAARPTTDGGQQFGPAGLLVRPGAPDHREDRHQADQRGADRADPPGADGPDRGVRDRPGDGQEGRVRRDAQGQRGALGRFRVQRGDGRERRRRNGADAEHPGEQRDPFAPQVQPDQRAGAGEPVPGRPAGRPARC